MPSPVLGDHDSAEYSSPIQAAPTFSEFSRRGWLEAVRMSALSTPDRRLLTGREVAELFGVSPRTVRRWATAGDLDSVRIGGVTRFREVDVLSVIEPKNEEGRPGGNGTPSTNSPRQGRRDSS
jgi:excisionase family DNA binding protein